MSMQAGAPGITTTHRQNNDSHRAYLSKPQHVLSLPMLTAQFATSLQLLWDGGFDNTALRLKPTCMSERRGAEMQRCSDVDCKHAEIYAGCKHAEMQRYSDANMQRCRNAEM